MAVPPSGWWGTGRRNAKVIGSITMIANHMQYLLPASPLDPPEPNHTKALDELLASYPFTHGHFQFQHFRNFFDAHCESRNGGPAPDPKKMSEGEDETFCDFTKPACMGTSPLYAVIKRYVPNVSFYYNHIVKGTKNVCVSTCYVLMSFDVSYS